LGLQPESAFDKGSDASRRWNLRQNGATPEEIEFLLRQRVELNALTSDQLIAFIERKLRQHGVKKIVPERKMLDEAFKLFVRNREIKKIIEREIKKLNGATANPPSNLSTQIRQYLEAHPEARWDEAVSEIAARTKITAAPFI
jgi:hypothetical protein